MSVAGSSQADWADSFRSRFFGWGIPKIAMVASLFADVPARTAVWFAALTWMGFACISNSRRCRRTHCRYTGPYYLLMIVPVLAVGFGVVPLDLTGWVILGGVILIGGRIIWWLSERAWGEYS